jgi:hypothetical protein
MLWAAAATAACSVREKTPDPPHAVVMAFTSSNKGITVRKSRRGFIPAVRSLFSKEATLTGFEPVLPP